MYQSDKKNIEEFLEHKSPTFNFASLRRLTLSELSYKGTFKYNRICGFTRNQILNMAQYPERYGNQIIRLSRYMYLKSGYYKRLVDYFVNMTVVNWTVDFEPKTIKALSPDEKMAKTIQSNYVKYVAQVNKFNLDNRITDIIRRMFIEDACFGFIVENDIETSLYILDSAYCEINSLVNGCVYEYSVNRSLINNNDYDSLPTELQEILEKSKEVSLNNMVKIPYENSLCLKYHNDFTYLYPTFLGLILDILDIDDVKDLSKAKSEADAYKIVYFKIPTNDDDQISMGDEIITPFVQMARDILPSSFGVIPSPMDVQLLESKSTVTDDTNKIEQAVENYYGEAGVSKALISSASSGSELKLSMKVDSSDIYRIYRMIEAWIDLQMKLRGFIYKDYQFVYNILPTTIYDVDDYLDRQLKLAQVSVPNKGRLLAANGINTSKLLGNTLLENTILSDVFDSWRPLATSFTQSGSSDVTDKGGRPEMDETEISEVTQNTHDNDGNDPDNRV